MGQFYSVQCTGRPPPLEAVARIQCINVPASTEENDNSDCLAPLVPLALARDQALVLPPGIIPVQGVS